MHFDATDTMITSSVINHTLTDSIDHQVTHYAAAPSYLDKSSTTCLYHSIRNTLVFNRYVVDSDVVKDKVQGQGQGSL